MAVKSADNKGADGHKVHAYRIIPPLTGLTTGDWGLAGLNVVVLWAKEIRLTRD